MSQSADQYFGIDFGTTCSAVTSFLKAGDQGFVQHCGDRNGRPVKSSVAVHRASGKAIVGSEAWERKLELSDEYEFIPSIKRQLGTSFRVPLPAGQLTPEDVACMLFEELTKTTREHTGSEVQEAVVAIPIGFTPDRRRELRAAAAAAGVHIASFVTEPTAAFFANYDELKHARTIAVFDWGGGTLDVSLLRHENGRIQELAASGLELAGNDIDALMAASIHARQCERVGEKIPFDKMPPKSRDKLLIACEEAKRQFSDADTATVRVNRYEPLGPCRIPLEYSEFTGLVAPVVDRAAACLEQALSEVNLTPESVDAVLLTGGSSALRLVEERLTEIFGPKLVQSGETSWNVADGAAALAARPGRHYSAQKIGLILEDGSYYPILEPGTPLDGWHATHSFGIADSSEQARIVFSGSRDIDSDPSGKNTIEFPSYNFMQELIQLHAEVDENLVFRVRATSSLRPESMVRVWEYPNLKTYYQMPSEAESVAEPS